MKSTMYKTSIIALLFVVFSPYVLCNKSQLYYNKAKKAYQKEHYCESTEYCVYAYIENEGKSIELQEKCNNLLNDLTNHNSIRRCTTPLEWLISYQRDEAMSLKKMGKLEESKSLLMSSTKTYFPLIGASTSLDNNIALSLLSTAHTFFETGFIDLAIQLTENAITLIGRHDTTSCLYAMATQDYAVFMSDIGEYELAEIFYIKALNIAQKQQDCQFTINSTLGNLAELYSVTGQQQEAEQILNAVIPTFGDNDLLPFISCSNNLMKLYRQTGRYKEAVQTFNNAQKRINGTSIKDVICAQMYINYGVLCLDLEEYNSAIKYTELGLKLIYEITGTTQSERYSNGLATLANILYKQGNYNLAEEYYLQSLNIHKQLGTHNTLLYTAHLNNLAQCYLDTRNFENAKIFYLKDFNSRKALTMEYFLFMSELQRAKFLSTQEMSYSLAYPRFCYYDYNNCDSVACFAYDNELFKKGLLLNASNEVKRSILESGDSTLIKKWELLQRTKERIIRLQSQPLDKQVGLKDLESKAEQLDKEITKASTAYREANANMSLTWTDIQNRLKDNDAAVEFVSFQDSTDITYYALLLRKGYKYPKLIPLCSEGEISKSFDPADEKRTAYTYSDTNNLYYKLWGKLATYIEDGANVYYSPSGMLHLINLEAIPVDQSTYLGDKYNMTRLSSTREIVMGSKQTADKTAALYGGIRYNLSANDMALESKRYASEEYILATRSIEYDSDSLYRGGIRELPGTKIEAEAIKKMLSPKFTKVTTFYADSANEESFKALSGKKYNILHIGTHGFFWPIEKASKQNLFKGRMTESDNEEASRYNPLADPLQRCGLLFAGAGLALSGKADSLAQSVEDGVLTAKEISNLDLRGTDLVVLSACKTGLGEVSGEGVFGLQRGFKQAGVKTIIMSLWKVNDITTKDFMLNFYRHLTNGAHKRDAFNSAVHETRKKYPQPEYWAAFVMVD